MINISRTRANEYRSRALARTPGEAEEGRGIAPHCARFEMAVVSNPVQAARMVLRLPTPVPSSMGYFYSGDLAWRVRGLLAREGFDLIFVHCSSVAQYVAGVHGTPKILDFGDMDSQKWLEYARYKPFPLSAGYWLEGRKLEREERRLAGLFDLCTATTRAEWETLEGYPRGSPPTFPEWRGQRLFFPHRRALPRGHHMLRRRMDYTQPECMYDFCAMVLPRIQLAARKRSAHNRRRSLAGGQELAERPGVTVTGSVPDVRPYLQRSALMVAPLNIARGTQNKILESMAAGVPVVTSGAAAGGVDAVAQEHFLVANAPEEHAAAVLRVLEDRGERARLAAAGRARMLSHHAWERSMRRLDRIIERASRRRGR